MSRLIPSPDAARGRRKGVALIVALGVLVVLALLGTVFATMTGIERSVARNYIDKVRARLLAESGIEQGLADLSRPEGMDIWRLDRFPKWAYFGGDENADGKLQAGEPDKNSDGYPDTYSVPVTEAKWPSFALDLNNDNKPDQVSVGGRQVGISGTTQMSTYGVDTDAYSLRVVDLGSRINVNNIHPNLQTILNNLARQVSGVPANLGDTIVARRPALGYANTNEIRAVVGATVFDKVKYFITTSGWTDPKETQDLRRVIKPVPLTGGYRRVDHRLGDDIYAWWELRPTGKFDPAYDGRRNGPRTPVNINTAPPEVLVALLTGLKGFYLYEDSYSTHPYDWYGFTCKYDGSMRVRRDKGDINGRVGTLYETTPIPPGTRPAGGTGVPGGGSTGAWAIAQAIVDERNKDFTIPNGIIYSGPPPKTKKWFRSFQEFNQFIDALDPKVFRPIPGWDQPRTAAPCPAAMAGLMGLPPNEIPMIRDVIKSNFNPNAHLNELNPDELIGWWVDKTDLTYHTYEFTFFPMGYFEIQSAGWVLDKKRDVVAEEVITSEVKLFECYRDTTQYDFMKDYINGASLNQVFSASSGRESVAFSRALNSYPEFQAVGILNKENTIPSTDGYLALNTVRTMDTAGANFSLRYDYWRRTFSQAYDPAPGGAGNFNRERNRSGRQRGPWLDRLLGGANPGSIANDGLVCEREASAGYANGNINQHRGALSMWVKPLFRPENAGRERAWFSCYYFDQPNEYAPFGPGGCNDVNEWWVSPLAVYFIANQSYGPNARLYNESTAVWYQWTDTTWPERTIGAGFGGRFPPGPSSDAWPWFGDNYPREYIGGSCCPTVNHVGHRHPESDYPAGSGWSTLCKAHRWVHVGFVWDDAPDKNQNNNITRLYVDGKPCQLSPGDSKYRFAYPPNGGRDAPDHKINTRWGPDDAVIEDALAIRDRAPFVRIGAESEPQRPPFPQRGPILAPRLLLNYTADATIDEVVLWWEANDGNVNTAYVEGRYYKENDATFTSPIASLGSQRKPRLLPPPGTAKMPPSAGTGSLGSTAPMAPPVPQMRLGIIAYSGYWPVLDVTDRAKQDLSGTVFSLSINDPIRRAVELMPMQPAVFGGTAITDNANYYKTGLGNPLVVQTRTLPDGTRIGDIRYRVMMAPNLANKNNVPLLYSPILDDVTITYYDQPPMFISWVLGEG